MWIFVKIDFWTNLDLMLCQNLLLLNVVQSCMRYRWSLSRGSKIPWKANKWWNRYVYWIPNQVHKSCQRIPEHKLQTRKMEVQQWKRCRSRFPQWSGMQNCRRSLWSDPDWQWSSTFAWTIRLKSRWRQYLKMFENVNFERTRLKINFSANRELKWQ